MPRKEDSSFKNNIPLDDLTYSSPGRKYSFSFSHLEKGIFLLKSKGYADDVSVRAQILAGDETRARLARAYPGTPFHLIWDLSEVKGASIFARYNFMLKATISGTFASISAIGANNLAKSFIKILSSLNPKLKFLFYRTIDEALNDVREKINSQKESNQNQNYYISPETESYSNFIDLWQADPAFLEINQQKYKALKMENWRFDSQENNFTVAYTILEGDIVTIKCEGLIKSHDIKKSYQILEEIMTDFGYVNSDHKFYTIIDLKNAKGISLNARKLTNYYEELYKERAHMVIMVPSPILHFALKVQKKINPASFNHWTECNSFGDAMDLVKNHKEGLSLFHNNVPNTNEKLVIPENKDELICLLKKIHAENKQIKHNQNEHIQRILEIAGRMTWDESFNNKIEFSSENFGSFSDIYNALSVIHADFKEIIKDKLIHAQKLRESEDKYWNLINLASDIIVVYQDGLFKLVNSRVKDVLGYTPEEAKDKSAKDLLHPEECLRIKKITENITNNTPCYFETHLFHKNGWLVPVSVSAGFITFENKPACMYIIRDITSKKIAEAELEKYRNQLEAMVAERTKQLEKEILERQSAEKSDRLKSAFLSNMSHEIRTPMNAIIAFSNFLRNPELSHAQKEEYITYIESSGQSLLNLINDIIDISKIEAKQITIHNKNVLLNPILDELYILFEETRKRSCTGSEVKLIKNVRVDNLVINTDPYRLKQILSNLLHNALKFTEKGSIEFGYEIKQNNIDFYVKDTGIGIPENKIEFIFQRFGKLEYSGKNKRGTGLGLAISHNLALLLNGKLSVESSLGKGSVFYLSIPFEEEQSIPVKTQDSEYVEKMYYNWENKLILVAEDEDLNFKVIQIALQKTHAEIIRASDGYEAVENILTNPLIDLVLMDIQMPRMDGYEALTKIKQINSCLPVIAQTAFAMIEEKDSCLRFGFNDYISKPIKISELLMKIDKFMI